MNVVMHKDSKGQRCGPLTNEHTGHRDPDVCRCIACGEFVADLTPAKLARVRRSDGYWRRRRDREERGVAPPVPRIMSFAMTEQQLMAGTKDVTRRLGWRGLLQSRLPFHIFAVRKAMGLRRGEEQHRLRSIFVVDVREERLDAITDDDCRREGFPELTPAQFVAMFCEHHRGCTGATRVMRIEFRVGDFLGPRPRQLALPVDGQPTEARC